jgi:hypothetical protein
VLDAKATLSEVLSSVQETTYLVAKSTTVSNPLSAAGGAGLYLAVAAVVPDSMDNFTLTAGPGGLKPGRQAAAAAAGQALLQMPHNFSAAYMGSAELLLPYLQFFADPSLFTASLSGPLLNQPGVLESYAVTGVGRAGLITAQNRLFTTEASGTLCQAAAISDCNVKLLLPTTRPLDASLRTQCLQYHPATGTFTLVSTGSAEVVVLKEGQSWVKCNISKPGLYLAQQSRSATPASSSSISQQDTVGPVAATANATNAASSASSQPSTSPLTQLGQAGTGSVNELPKVSREYNLQQCSLLSSSGYIKP